MSPLTLDILCAQDPALFKKISAPCILPSGSHGVVPNAQILFEKEDTSSGSRGHLTNQEASGWYFDLTVDMRNKPIHALNSSGLRAGSADEIKIKR